MTAPRLAELVATLSLATDLGMAQPMEHALRSCALSLALGRAAGLAPEAMRELYYVSLLRRAGCTGDAHELQVLFGDDLEPHARVFTLDFARPSQLLADLLRHAGANRAPLERARVVLGALRAGPEVPRSMFRASCEVARRLADQLGLPAAVGAALGQTFERWDGRGLPDGVAGPALALPARIAQLCEDAEVARRAGGVEAALDAVRRGAGARYDPQLVAPFCAQAASWFDAIDAGSPWDAVLDAEPGPWRRLDEAGLDAALAVFAHFADLKSPFTSGHSSGVAGLVAAAAGHARLPVGDAVLLRRAALVHDLGRVAVSAGVWDHPGTLSFAQWEQVRLHAYHGERLLSRAGVLAPLARLAGAHHERLDGSGYHRGASGAVLDAGARLLAAADCYHAMTEPRPHREALAPEHAIRELRDAVRAGRLDGAAVDAVLRAAGHRVRRKQREWPAGLSAREVEVLRLLVRGAPNRVVAQRLGISAATVSHHVQHIYTKIGVSTRAGATLFAMQHGLVDAAQT